MTPLLAEAFAALVAHPGKTPAYDAVERVLKAYGEASLAERLVADTDPAVPDALVGDLFDYLSWQTSDNGSALSQAGNEWLRDAADERRCAVVLFRQEVYPFIDRIEMEAVLPRVAEAFPRLSDRCAELIAMRRRGSGA